MWFGADVSASVSSLLISFEPINGFSLNFAQTSTEQRPHYYILVIKFVLIMNAKEPMHAVAEWLRQYATSWKVAGSRPHEVKY
jgi:hypothetical protein